MLIIACSDIMSRLRLAGWQFWQIRKASSKIQRDQLIEYAEKMTTRRSRYDKQGTIIFRRLILRNGENKLIEIYP